MQQTIKLQRGSERTILSSLESIVKNCKEWLNAKSESFSLIMEESVTRIQVLRFHLLLLSLFVLIGTVETSFPIALIAMACAAFLVYRINKADNETDTRKGGNQ